MATHSFSRKSSFLAASSQPSNPGGLAPINTPFAEEITQDGHAGKNVNVYVVQPFKHASKPKDMIKIKKGVVNPGEELLHSTIEVINHFSLCYERVKQQLVEQENQQLANQRETNSNKYPRRVVKQARLRPLIVHEDQRDFENNRRILIDDSIGISPRSGGNDVAQLNEMYREKLDLLRKLRPELFDANGTLRSNNRSTSNRSSYQLTMSNNPSMISQNSNGNRTFLSEIPLEEEEEDEASNDQTSSISQVINDNSVLTRIDITTKTSAKK